MFDIDRQSLTLTLDTDYRWSEIESELARQGYTSGYFCPPDNALTLKQTLAQNTPNLYACQFGHLSDLCVALQWESKSGKLFKTAVVPRQATGANWKNMMIGSQDQWGLVYQATLKIFLKESESLIFLVAYSSLQEMHQLERLLIRHEMQPFVFGRFTYKELKEVYGAVKGQYFLVLEWQGTEKYFKRLRAEWNHRVAAHTPYQVIERHDTQKQFAKLLRKKNPDSCFGATSIHKSDASLKDIAKVLAKSWR